MPSGLDKAHHPPQDSDPSHSNGVHETESKFDPHFTDNVVNATGPNADPRAKKAIASLTRHLHDWARENEITMSEFMAGIHMINRAGQMSDDKRNESLLLSDILGLESLVDEITYKLVSETNDAPTASAVMGPFWRKDAPIYDMGESIVKGFSDADHAFVRGRILDYDTGKPIENAEVDVWHAGPNGLYENQDEDQPPYNLRGRFYTTANGEYSFYCLRPTKYPIPLDGPGRELLELLDRHPYRPAHVHFILRAKGYKPLVTQVFDRKCEYVHNDSVFAVKDSLIVDFEPRVGDDKAQFELEYDFKLASLEAV